MSVFTSAQFASAAASGTDWRAAAKKVLEQLESARTPDRNFNLGFLYLSDHLADDADSIIGLFSSVLQIENWIGAVGIGVCGNGEAFIDEPAIAALIGEMKPEDFCVFPGRDAEPGDKPEKLAQWLEKKEPMMIFVHGDPLAQQEPGLALKGLERMTGGFIAGGLSSSRREHIQFAGGLARGGLSGAAFSCDIKVATSLSQGCAPIGPVHTITRADDHIIMEIDSRKATHVFEDDLRAMALARMKCDPQGIPAGDDLAMRAEAGEFKGLFRGEIHVAFPVPGSDQNDYLVRNIIGMDPEEGAIVISQTAAAGETLLFVHRDDDTVRQDLSRSLLDLRKRVQQETGTFAPRAGIYVSCVARAFSHSENGAGDEMTLVREIVGDIPLAGFYAGGEICGARLYGYTGILTLFL